MNQEFERLFPFVFPVAFAAMWVLVSVFLGLMSGWFQLAQRYPDRDEQPLLSLTSRSGSMGLGVGLNGILNLYVCPSGLRVGMWRLFGPFSRDFLVPWREIRVIRGGAGFWKSAKLVFGDPTAGRLTIPAHLADRLARASQGRWPERGPFPEETAGQSAGAAIGMWAAGVAAASAFFIIVPRLASPSGPYPPIAAAILLPAIVLGVAMILNFIRRRG